MFEDIFPDIKRFKDYTEIDGMTVCPWQKGTEFNCPQFVGVKVYQNQPEKYSLCEYLNESNDRCRYEWHGSGGAAALSKKIVQQIAKDII